MRSCSGRKESEERRLLMVGARLRMAKLLACYLQALSSMAVLSRYLLSCSLSSRIKL
jgi:hypothetical protein